MALVLVVEEAMVDPRVLDPVLLPVALLEVLPADPQVVLPAATEFPPPSRPVTPSNPAP